MSVDNNDRPQTPHRQAAGRARSSSVHTFATLDAFKRHTLPADDNKRRCESTTAVLSMCPATDELLLDTIHLYAPRGTWTPPLTWQGWHTGRRPYEHHWHDYSTGWHLRTRGGTLRIEGSIRTLVDIDNLYPATTRSLPVLHDYLTTIRRKLRLSFIINDLLLSRVDLAADAPLDCMLYISEAARAQTIETMRLSIPPHLWYDGYALWTSGREQALCLYNKSVEMWQHGNLLRVEYRMLRHRIAAAAGISTIKDLETLIINVGYGVGSVGS